MKYKIMSIVFALCLIAAFAAVMLGGGDVSGENRAQSEMPELTLENIKSGEFADGVEAYLGDKIAFRSEMIDLSQKISEYKGVDVPEGKVILADVDMGTGEKKATNLLILDGAIMEMFSENRAAADKYAEALNILAENLGDIKLYSMLVPTQLEFRDELYSNLQDSQKDEIDYIYSRTDSAVNAVDVYGALEARSGEYIYFRSDHHWTMLGAYYGYEALCAETGAQSVSIDDYEKRTINGFFGRLSAYAGTEEIKADTIEWYDVNERGNIDWSMTAYKSSGESYNYRSVLYDESRSDYDFFLGSDHAFARFTNSELPDGKTIIIICDSYANDFAPWLMNNYKNVILIDPRTYMGSLKDTISEYNPDEALVLNYIFTASFEDYCAVLLNLCAGAA
ncbi:MAG: hypothetical protein LUD03_02480 [Firmicutes bacterium]|nr:hypothetical protein [Bacillota bacterium]